MLLRARQATYYLFSSLNNNLSFQALKDQGVRQNLTTAFSHNQKEKEKLDALTNVLFSLNQLQIQYLLALRNQEALKKGEKISNNLVINLSSSKLTTMQYLYQKRWVQQVWKDYCILTSLYSDQNDKEGVQQVVETVKQIYEIQLTSVDPAQKIKVIKVIRQLLNLGLKEAKDIVDKAPTVMKKGKKDQGQKLKEELAKSGCVVTLK